MPIHPKWLLGMATLVLVHGCAFVDSSFSKRIDTIDHGYDEAVNTEILTNIIRASRQQPVRFYAHSKIAPSQTADFKFAIPSFTFGPGRSGATKQFGSSGSLADNSASLSLQLDPIETREFHRNILKPTGIDVLGLLLQNYPREFVFLAMIESIRVQTNGAATEYRNDPLADDAVDTQQCPDGNFAAYDDKLNRARSVEETIKINNEYPYGPFDDLARACPTHHFAYWLHMAVTHGLSIKLAMTALPNPADPSKTISQLQGVFCFDAAKAELRNFRSLERLTSCNDAKVSEKVSMAIAGEPLTFPFVYKSGAQVDLRIDITSRSLYGTLAYLGKLASLQADAPIAAGVDGTDAQKVGGSRLLTVRQGIASKTDCFASAAIDGNGYCVPAVQSDASRQTFSMLSELIALNFMANDVPTSFTVRVTP